MLHAPDGPCAGLGRPLVSPRRTFKRPRALRLRDRGDDERGALAMGAIPIHLQRKFEQRWAARFASPVASAAPRSTGLKGTANNLSRGAKTKEKPAELGERSWSRPHKSDITAPPDSK
jgi:hypothetical protein